MRKQTPSQTVGPYLHIGLIREPQNVVAGDDTEGERIRVEGRVLDGEDQPINDAMIEIWQANSHGRYNHPEDEQDKPLDPAFKGFGRSATDGDGAFWFETIKPGSVPGPGNAPQAPHLNVTVFARGMLLHAMTRLYFADEAANEIDPVLNSIEDTARRGTLIAERSEAGGGPPVYRFDIHLQGADETVFFDA
jgi:protocatechuate 3,4-dioxygenase alpha subunit